MNMVALDMQNISLEEKIDVVDKLVYEISTLHTSNEINPCLLKLSHVKNYLRDHPEVFSLIQRLTDEEKTPILKLIALKQEVFAFQGIKDDSSALKHIQALADNLNAVDQLYSDIGGIIGYHLTLLKLIRGDDLSILNSLDNITFDQPQLFDVRRDEQIKHDAIRFALENIADWGEIYVIGGAGDRLDLRDSEDGRPLPAAELKFFGRTLLEGLIRDVQGREYLSFKLTDKQVFTRLALMTSFEKDNHNHILRILESKKWFERPRDSYKFFCQPLTPVITKDGDWSFSEPMVPNLKPGGHGVMWKLAADHMVFDWFQDSGRENVIVRQINNPVSGFDEGILALFGFGAENKKAFGFTTCDRLVNAAEGMIVQANANHNEESLSALVNIEYTELKKWGLKDQPKSSKEPFSTYPANVNLLFANLESVRGALTRCSLPGLIVNLKSQFSTLNREGQVNDTTGGRLESTMQNISDLMMDKNEHPALTFGTFNERRKTLSPTKNSYKEGECTQGTPESAFYDCLKNHHELFSDWCGLKMPKLTSFEKSLKKTPPFMIDYHPALGPLYSVISQKISGGSFKEGSELQLEIAELEIQNLHLEGSLLIHADSICGHLNNHKERIFSNQNGKCRLIDVRVENRGIDFSAENIYWKNQIKRSEALEIEIHGNGEFFAEGVAFQGGQKIVVNPGERVIATSSGLKIEKISQPSWEWRYTFDQDNRVKLSRSSESHK